MIIQIQYISLKKGMVNALKKNQIIIFAIALMLITAGYLNYSMRTEQTAETSAFEESEKMAGIGDAKLVSNNNAYVVVNDVMNPFVYLDNYNFYKVKNEYDKDTFLIYVSPVVEQYNCYEINEQLEKGFSIGKSGKCLIKYSVCKDVECYIKKENDKIYVINNEGNVYVNNVRLFNKVELKIGDIIFINGLRIIINGNDNHGVSYSLYVNNIK